MIISPKNKKSIIEVGDYNGQSHTTIWRMGEFLVDELPKVESDGSVILSPLTLLGCWDEWETTISTDLRTWDFDKQPIENEDFKKSYKIIHYKILDGYVVNGIKGV